jgi:hypothetical protein
MNDLQTILNRSLCAGACATAATTATLAACAAMEHDPVAAPINSVSHIAWGDEAASHDEVSMKYTATGFALNAVAVTSWAAVHELMFGSSVNGDPLKALASGAAVSAVAYLTDYHLVPARLTPGFEKRLSNRSLFAVYAALALSLAAGSLQANGEA